MSSTSPSAGLNSLIVADVATSSQSKRSMLNPEIGDKVLNNKEFSEVLDDRQALQKVAANSKISDRSDEPARQDQNGTVIPAAAEGAQGTDVAAGTGKLLPLQAQYLPLDGSDMSSLVDVAQNSFFNATTITTTGGNEGQLDTELAGSASPVSANTHSVLLQAEGESSGGAGLLADPEAISVTLTTTFDGLTPVNTAAGTTVQRLVSSAITQDPALMPAFASQRLDSPANRFTPTLAAGFTHESFSQTAEAVIQSPSAVTNTSINDLSITNKLASGESFSAALASSGYAAQVNNMADKGVASSLATDIGDVASRENSLLSTLGGVDVRQAYQTATQHAATTAAAVDVSKPAFSESVMHRVMWMSSQQINTAEIALDPPELGSLQVRISTQADQTSVVFSSNHSAVRDALDQNLPRLRDMLEQQGLNLSDVNVADQGAHQRQQQDNPVQVLANHAHEDSNLEEGGEPSASSTIDPMTNSLHLVDHYV